MGKIIVTENQFNLLTKSLMNEAVGVPEKILDSGKKLYEIVIDKIKEIKPGVEKSEFTINDVDLEVADTTFNTLEITVEVSELKGYDGPIVLASMGMGNEFKFDEGIMMQVNKNNKKVDLHLNFVTSDNWNINDLIKLLKDDEINTISIMSHELMHKYSRHKTPYELIGNTADYQAYASSGLNFGIPVINKFMRYSYFIQVAENIVRPTEVASRMIQKGITRDQFYDFMVNDPVYKELKEIREFSFEYLISKLKEELDSVDALLKHAGLDINDLTDQEKIVRVLELVYINLANAKKEMFDKFFFTAEEMIFNMFGPLARLMGKGKEASQEKQKIRNKYLKYVIKYEDREIDFFKDECERFNYVATNLMKKISKIYSLIPDEKDQTNESILNWELHQELMEKKYGKRKIQTEYMDELKSKQTPKNGLNLLEKNNTNEEDKEELPSGGKVRISNHKSIPDGMYFFWKDRSGSYQVTKSYQARDSSYSIGEYTLKKYLGI